MNTPTLITVACHTYIDALSVNHDPEIGVWLPLYDKQRRIMAALEVSRSMRWHLSDYTECRLIEVGNHIRPSVWEVR